MLTSVFVSDGLDYCATHARLERRFQIFQCLSMILDVVAIAMVVVDAVMIALLPLLLQPGSYSTGPNKPSFGER